MIEAKFQIQMFLIIQKNTSDKAFVQDLCLIFVFSAGIGIARKCLSLAGYCASIEKCSSCLRGPICCLVKLSSVQLAKDDHDDSD